MSPLHINSRTSWLRDCLYSCLVTFGPLSASSSLPLWPRAGIREMYSLEICMYLTWFPSCILAIYMKVTPPLMGVRCFLILYRSSWRIYPTHPCFQCLCSAGMESGLSGEGASWWYQAIKNLPKEIRKGLNLLIILVAWEIWKHRNDCVFNGARPNTRTILQTVALCMCLLVLSQCEISRTFGQGA